MKNVFYILIFASCAFFFKISYANEYKEKCMQYRETPNVRIALEFDELKYNHTKTPRTLSRMQREKYTGKLLNGYQVMGLTTYDFGTELNFKLEEKIINNGLTCYYPTEVNLVISMRYPTIYISKTVAKSSCQYEQLLRHEYMHLELATAALKAYIPVLKERFLEAIKKYPVAGRAQKDVSLDVVREDLTKKYMSVLTPLVQTLQDEINTEQAKLDTPENYNSEQKLCSN